MSLFKQFANFCRNSNNAADQKRENARANAPRRETKTIWQACSTCRFLETDDPLWQWDDRCGGVRFFYYCPKQGYIDPDDIDKQKCDKYSHNGD